MIPFTASATGTHILTDHLHHHHQQQHQISGDATLTVEAASPISSRPPAVAASSGNFDGLVQLSGSFLDYDTLAGEEAERGVGRGNRWPRQETLALLKIRSEMDAVFRSASLKGPLWDDVSRKLGEVGYNRSAKKCKEKFENVHKYYKRTKQGRSGRQEGKSYRFFTQLEALHSSSNTAMPPTTTTPTNAIAAPVSIGIGISSQGIHPTTQIGLSQIVAPQLTSGLTTTGVSRSAATAGVSFSSDSSSSSDSEDDLDGEPSNTDSRKRKRGSRGGSKRRKMMDFFEQLMKQVMEKQETMQRRFLESIEKREQERVIKEETWRRQEMARLTRDQETMAKEKAVSASRDAAVISFLQKITGQTIQFLPPITIPAAPPPPPPHHHHQSQITEIIEHQSASSQVLIAVPEQQQPPQEMGSGGGGSFDPTTSRWPKAEVLALIKLRGGLDSRYQEIGPKGALWEEISAGMKRMGYNRSSKRCKEKWENINKYFKKVKESNKKRPEDAKTCPYFHQLDALYRKKILGRSGDGSGFVNQNKLEQQQDPNPSLENRDVLAIMPPPNPTQTTHIEHKNNNMNGESTEVKTSNGGGASAKKPEDIVKELIKQQQLVMDDYDKLDQEEDDGDEEEESKMGYKIEFQMQKSGSSNGAASFLAMVQ